MYNTLLNKFIERLKDSSTANGEWKTHDAFLATLGTACKADIVQLNLSHLPGESGPAQMRLWSKYNRNDTLSIIKKWFYRRDVYKTSKGLNSVKSVAGFWRQIILETNDCESGNTAAIHVSDGVRQACILAGLPALRYFKFNKNTLSLPAHTVYISKYVKNNCSCFDTITLEDSWQIHELAAEELLVSDSSGFNSIFRTVMCKTVPRNSQQRTDVNDETLKHTLTFLCGCEEESVSFVSIPLFLTISPEHGKRTEILSVEIVWRNQPLPSRVINHISDIHHFVSFVVPYFELPHMVQEMLEEHYFVIPDEALDRALMNLAYVLREELFKSTHEVNDVIEAINSNGGSALVFVLKNTKILRAIVDLQEAVNSSSHRYKRFVPSDIFTLSCNLYLIYVLKCISRIYDSNHTCNYIPLFFIAKLMNVDLIENYYKCSIIIPKEIRPSQVIGAYDAIDIESTDIKLEYHRGESRELMGQTVTSTSAISIEYSFQSSGWMNNQKEKFIEILNNSCENRKGPCGAGQSTRPYFLLGDCAKEKSFISNNAHSKLYHKYDLKEEK